MKKTTILLISLLLLNWGNLSSKQSVTATNLTAKDSLRILSTPDLFNLSIKWADEYNRLYPEKKIKIVSVSDTRMAEKLIAEGNTGFFSKEKYQGLLNESLWKVVVGREVLVPVINSKNPYSDEINKQGISPETFSRFFSNPNSQKWGALLGNKEIAHVNYYWTNDESITKGLTEFLNINQIKINGIKIENREEMISSIQKDPYSIGFCKITNIIDFKTQNFIENIRLLPIDRNGNGLIDYNEKIYDNFSAFTRGVWIGKYPKSLISNIYSVSSDQPKNETEAAFIKWVLTDGQQYLYSNGFSDLLLSERQTTIDKLYNAKIYPGAATADKSLLKAFMFIIAAIVLAGLIVNVLSRYRKRKKAAVQFTGTDFQPFPDENSLIIPKGIYFDKSHTWAFMEQNGVVKVGVDDFLQHITGTITRIKLKDEGDLIKKGEQVLSIVQNGKQLNLYSPLSGIIKEHNKALYKNSSMINSSPYNDGWVYKIEPTNWRRENQLLFMANRHKEHIKNEFSRLKDFLAAALKPETGIYSGIILQDGGELRDSTLSNLGPEIWEEFQTKFIDPSRQLWFYEIF